MTIGKFNNNIPGEEGSEVYTLKFDPEDKYLAAGCSDGSIRIYNLFTGNISYFLTNDKNLMLPREE